MFTLNNNFLFINKPERTLVLRYQRKDFQEHYYYRFLLRISGKRYDNLILMS